jgi:DNA-binding response OmpR family regulator
MFPASDGSQIRVLAVTRNASDWQSLEKVANNCGWALFWADSCAGALSVLSQYTIPIVICDRDLPGEDWRSVLKRIADFRQPVCTLLASSVSDEYLWREVFQHQGFDVLPKPFEPERLTRTVNLAWSSGDWMQRQPGGGVGR